MDGLQKKLCFLTILWTEANIHTFYVKKDITLEDILSHIKDINDSQKQLANSFFHLEKARVSLNNQEKEIVLGL
jgi:hypothetical protein